MKSDNLQQRWGLKERHSSAVKTLDPDISRVEAR